MSGEEPNFDHFETDVSYVTTSDLDDLAEAMIDAYMRRGGLQIVDGSCKEGKFRYIQGPVYYGAQTYEFYVSYPGGEWTSDGGLIGDDQPADYIPFDAVSQVYEPIKQAVSTGLTPLVKAPRPTDFNDQVAVVQHVMQHLSVSGEVRTTGSGSETSIEVGDNLVPQYISEIHNELSDLDGVAVVRLRQVYGGDKINDVMTGLHALTTVAGVLVAGEAQVWARFHRDFSKLIDSSTNDFHAFAEGNDVSAGEVFDVVMSLADASGVLSLPKGVATVIGKAKTIGGIVEGFLPDPPPPHDYTLQGSSVQALFDSFWQAVTDLVTDVDETEKKFTKCADNAVDAATNKNGDVTTSFDLKNPEEFLHAGPDGIYRDENGRHVNIQITDNALNRIAGRYEAIGDHCRDLARKLEGAPAQGPWQRDFTATGSLIGHFLAFDGMCSGVASLLRDNATEMTDVGKKCVLILKDFHASDKEVRRELNGLTTEVVDLARQDAKADHG